MCGIRTIWETLGHSSALGKQHPGSLDHNNRISDISALSGLSPGALSLRGNFLNYPSLTTHIPALQSRGARVVYDARTLTSLVKISGDDQTGTAGSRLSDPFIVEVRDTNDVAFAGVPVAFSKWPKSYSLRVHEEIYLITQVSVHYCMSGRGIFTSQKCSLIYEIKLLSITATAACLFSHKRCFESTYYNFNQERIRTGD